MTIVVLAVGSRGDVQPYLALAFGLKRAGYKVRFAANSNFERWVKSYGLEFAPIRVDSYAFVQDPRGQAWLESGNFLHLALNSVRILRPALDQTHRDAWDACRGAEAIVYHTFTLPTGYYLGERLGVPCLPASMYPLPTGAHPALPFNFPNRFGGAVNRLTHELVDAFAWQTFRASAVASWHGNVKVRRTHPNRRLRREARPIVCGYSSAVLPRPPDLADQVHITGYWFLEAEPGWGPDPALVEFLQSGPPPVYVGFGSMGNPARARETTQIVIDALARAGQRGMLASGWGGLGNGVRLPESVFVVDSVPHGWLLPQMAAIAHHGGVGTTGAALAAGRPNVVVPHFADQHFWGRRVVELGAGPAPISRRHLTAERLAGAILEAVDSESIRARAAELGARVREEDGVARTIEIFRHFVGRAFQPVEAGGLESPPHTYVERKA